MESTLPAAAPPSRRRSCPATHCASAGSGWSYAARCSSPCSAATKRRCNHVTQHQVKPPWEVGCRGGSACVTQSARCMGWSHRNSHLALLNVEQITLQLCHLTTLPQHQKRNHNNRASTWRAGRWAAGGAEPAAPGPSAIGADAEVEARLPPVVHGVLEAQRPDGCVYPHARAKAIAAACGGVRRQARR